MQSILTTVVGGGLFRYNVYYVKSFIRFSPIHVQYVCKYSVICNVQLLPKITSPHNVQFLKFKKPQLIIQFF